MKKFTLFFVIVSLCVSTASAQFKPRKGDFTAELQFSPFSLSSNEYQTIIPMRDNWYIYPYALELERTGKSPVFTMPGLRVRYFATDRLAVRLNLNYDFNKDSQTTDLAGRYVYLESGNRYAESGASDLMSKRTFFSMAPGVEYHFVSAGRLSAYVGAEISFGRSWTESDASTHLVTKVSGGGESEVYDDVMKTTGIAITDYATDGYTIKGGDTSIFGAGLLAGFDFYIYNGLYLGTEIALAYNSTKLLEHTVYHKRTYSNNPDANFLKDDTFDKDKQSSASFRFVCMPQIRLGWRF